ncbi:hypothetical protein [Bradyrhizobium sp. SZCCHNS3053]|uniref:hypothetical protein n=1 Tax=Bradyrhizobium sp. SZCCHNS3053 TaxID=3057322 RepID=UPI002915FAAE|nr:hypothetical protein [Bradyrhizobium sp. SZCCHNS3053]
MQKVAALRAAASLYWAQARQLASTKGKAIAAALAMLIVFAFAFHIGAKGKIELKVEIAELKKQLTDEQSKPAQPEIPYWQCNGPKETRHPKCPDDSAADTAYEELQQQLAQSEAAKAKLEKKVKDYETQLARRPAKAGACILSPADARSLSNIR